MEHIFLLTGLILALFFAISLVSQRLRLPPLLGYIFLGAGLLPFLEPGELALIEEISRIGIVFLFLLLGLQFPLNRLVNVTRRVWRAGTLDVVLCFGGSALLAFGLGFDLFSSLVLGGVAYATSSSITIQMIKDTHREKTPEAEFSMGLLIFEDLVAPVMVSVLVGIGLEGVVTAGTLGSVGFRVLLLIVCSLAAARILFRRLELFMLRHRSREFLIVFVVGVAFLMSGLAEWMGLSKLLGAFLAGVMLSETGAMGPLRERLAPLRDLTLPVFFFWFGTSMTLGTGVVAPRALVLLIVWGLLAKMAVGLWGGRDYGLTRRGAFRTSFGLGQRGEFSIVIAALAGPGLLVFSGIYIVVTSLLGVLFFRKAPVLGDAAARRWDRLTGRSRDKDPA